jgi:hypothetical protein
MSPDKATSRTLRARYCSVEFFFYVTVVYAGTTHVINEVNHFTEIVFCLWGIKIIQLFIKTFSSFLWHPGFVALCTSVKFYVIIAEEGKNGSLENRAKLTRAGTAAFLDNCGFLKD